MIDLSKIARSKESLELVVEMLDSLHAFTAGDDCDFTNGMTGWELWNDHCNPNTKLSYEVYKQCLRGLINAGDVVPTGETIERPNAKTNKPSLASQYYRLSTYNERMWPECRGQYVGEDEKYQEWRDKVHDGWKRIPDKWVGKARLDNSLEIRIVAREK